MPFGRWLRLVGWRHLVAIIFVVWALFPAFYVINLAFSGGQHADRGVPAEQAGVGGGQLHLPDDVLHGQLRRRC